MPNLHQIWIRILFTYQIPIQPYHSINPPFHHHLLQHPKLIIISSPTNTHFPIIIPHSFNPVHPTLHKYRINMTLSHIYPQPHYPPSPITNSMIPHYIPSSNTLNTRITGIWMTCPDMNTITYYLAGITSITKASSCIDMAIQMPL